MALPAAVNTTTLDSVRDDVRLARPDLADLVGKFNQLLTDFGNMVEADFGAGLFIEGGELKIRIRAQDNVNLQMGTV